MDLILVRHAIAFERDAIQWPDDSERPLTPEGAKRFRRAARGLRKVIPRVDVVLSSPFARAWQTAGILTEEAGWPAPRRCRALEVDATFERVEEALRPHARVKRVALVGHEPSLSILTAAWLSGENAASLFEFKKGGVAWLHFAEAPISGLGALVTLLPPRVLRELAG